jgi:transposase InsO family protein
VQNATLWRGLLGVEKTVVEWVEFDEDEQLLVARVRPRKRARGRCGRCGRSSPGYDRGEGRRRWRALDLGTVQVVLEANAPRVSCREHGPTVAAVPWARHGAGHTYGFDEQVAWLATQASKSAVTQLMRIAWRTVGSIIARVWADTEALYDRFAGLTRIGIDEISYKRGHKYLTIVVDHDPQFKTMKYAPVFPENFGSLADARAFGERFFGYYNHEHRHSGIGLHTPASVHHGTAAQVRALRQQTLDAAYAAHPHRFGHRRPRPPKHPTEAWINQPSREALIQSA